MTTTTQDPIQDERMGLPSASKFHRLVNCPGSESLSKSVIEERAPEEQAEQTPEAERGTRIHKARETGDPSELQDESERTAWKNWIKLEMRCMNEWAAQLGIHGASIIEGPRELRLWLNDPTTMEAILSGRLDIHYHSHRKIIVIDGKTGQSRKRDEAKNDWQLRIAAVLCKYEYDAEHVRVVLLKCEDGKNGSASIADYDEQTLNLWEYSIQYHLWFAAQPNAPRRAGEWCRYCPARGICPEAAAMALIPTVNKGDALEMVERLSPEDLSAIWMKHSLLDSIMDAIEVRLKKMTDTELAAIGLRRGKARQYPRCTDMKRAKEILVAEGLTDEEIADSCMSMSVPGIVELVKNYKAIPEKEAKAWVAAQLESCITIKSGEPSIIPA